MPVTIYPQFGDFVFHTGSADVTTWREEPTIRGRTTPIPRSERAAALDGVDGEREFTLEGVLCNEAWSLTDDLRSARDSLLQALRPGFRKLYLYSDRYIVAEARSVTLGDDTGLLAVPYTVRFTAVDPFWYSTVQYNQDWANLPSGAQTLAVSGLAHTWPLITVGIATTGTLGFTLTNSLDPDATIHLVGDVEAGDQIAIDCYEQDVTILRGGQTINGMQLFDGDFLRLMPGNNSLTYGQTGDAEIGSINLQWRARWR